MGAQTGTQSMPRKSRPISIPPRKPGSSLRRKAVDKGNSTLDLGTDFARIAAKVVACFELGIALHFGANLARVATEVVARLREGFTLDLEVVAKFLVAIAEVVVQVDLRFALEFGADLARVTAKVVPGFRCRHCLHRECSQYHGAGGGGQLHNVQC